jgi:hypothetical protein
MSEKIDEAENSLDNFIAKHSQLIFSLSRLPKDAPDTKLKEYKEVVVANSDEVNRKLEESSGRAEPGHLLQAGGPYPASEHHEVAAVEGEAGVAALQPHRALAIAELSLAAPGG